MKIEIHTMSDSSYCDACGSNYDEGGYVLVDGVAKTLAEAKSLVVEFYEQNPEHKPS